MNDSREKQRNALAGDKTLLHQPGKKSCSTPVWVHALIRTFVMLKESLPSFVRLLFSSMAVMCLSQCSTPPQQPVKSGTTVVSDGSYWSEKPVMGAPKIVISLDEQLVGLFRNGKIQGISPISSGMEGFGTPTGTFKVIEKDPEHRSSLYGCFVDDFGRHVVEDVCTRTDAPPPGTRFVGAPMFYFMRFTGAVGMHQGYLPGYPASHGCIRLPAKMAALFYYATPKGTPVEVRHDARLVSLFPKAEPEKLTPSKPLPTPAPAVSAPPVSSPPVATPVIAKTTAPAVSQKPAKVLLKPAPRITEKPGSKKKPEKMPRGTTLYWDGN